MSVIGLRVGPFEIVEEASVPEQGEWYLAKRTGMTRRKPAEVFVKWAGAEASSAEREALQREFENLRAVEDPRVPSAIAYYEGTCSLAITAVEGIAFSEVIEGRRTGLVVMTPATLLDFLLEVSETLQHLDHRGRFHGALHPGALWLGQDGKIWIFGIGPGDAAELPRLWSPPERLRGEMADTRTDQWALGALAVGLVTGRPPWKTAPASIADQRDEVAQAADTIEAQWPQLGRLIRQLLEVRADNRMATLGAVRQELLALSRRAGGTSERREIGTRLARARRAADVPLQFSAIAEPPVPEPPPTPPPAAAAEAAPAENGEPPSTPAASPAPTPAVATPRQVLPEEQMPVVRPDFDGETIPEAVVQPSAEVGPDSQEVPEAPAAEEPEAPPQEAEPEPQLLPLLNDQDLSGVKPAGSPTDIALEKAVQSAKQDLEAQQEDPSAQQSEQADLEPSEATILFDPEMHGALKDAIAAVQDDSDPDGELSEATVLFDSSMLDEAIAEFEGISAEQIEASVAGGPGQLPPSDPASLSPVKLDIPSGPSIGEPQVFSETTPHDEDSQPIILGIAPWIATAMLLVFGLWVLSTIVQ